MSGYHAAAARAGSFAGMSPAFKAVLATVGVLAVLAVSYGANRELARDVESQAAQEERDFCVKLTGPAGAQHDSCMQELSRLIRREQEIRSVEF